MIKRIFTLASISFALATASWADWKTELLSYLGPRPDFQTAREYLDRERASLDEADKQTALSLLAFLSSKTSDAAAEQDLISDYFETYHDNHPDIGFLDDWTRRDFLNFWSSWIKSYPLVTGVTLLEYREASDTGLPASIEVGLDLLNGAFYKISIGDRVLEGGHWGAGFHILTIPVSGLFEDSGTYDFMLDLKTGAQVLRKPIRIDVAVSVLETSRPSFPTGGGFTQPGEPGRITIPEGEISLYVGGKLVLTSKKLAPKGPESLKIPLPGPSMPGTKPYLPPPKDDPMSRGVSILDALSLAYKAIKDLTSKKPPKPSPPTYRKATAMTYSFYRWGSGGETADGQAVVRVIHLKGSFIGDGFPR